MSEEKGLFPPFSGFPRCSSHPPEKGEKCRERVKKADFGRFPGRTARHPLSPHLLHPHLRQPKVWENRIGGFRKGGFSNSRFVLKPDVAIASEVSIFSKNSLAITDFHAKKTQHVQLLENPLPGTLPFAIPKE